MVDFLSSSVQVIEEEPSVRILPQLATAVLGIVGLAERGPLDNPTVVSSYDDFVRIFGGFRVGDLMSLEVRQAFLNGTRQSIVTRVLEGTPATAAANLLTAAFVPTSGAALGGAAPFVLSPAQHIDLLVDGAGPTVATFDAAAASQTAANSPTYALTDLNTLEVSIDGGPTQIIVFNTAAFADIANATATEVLAVFNAGLSGAFADLDSGAVRILSDLLGTDSSVEIVGGTDAAAFAFPGGAASGTGDVANIAAVTVAEAKIVIEADVANVTVNDVAGVIQIVSSASTGVGSTIQIVATTDATGFGFDNAVHAGSSGAAAPTLQVDASSEGDWANGVGGVGVNIQIAVPSNGIVTGADAAFNFVVIKNGVLSEIFANVNMNPASDLYVVDVVNNALTGSVLVIVTDLLIGLLAPANAPVVATTPMAGGTEGDPITDATFTGGGDSEKGLNAMEPTPITLLAIPDRPTIATQGEMITFCEVTRNGEVFAILDPPIDSDVAGIRAHKAALPTSEYYALFWPRVTAANPSPSVFGSDTTVPVAVSGSIAGMMARNDAATLPGPFTQPAGVEAGILFSTVGLESKLPLRKSNRDLVFPERINPIRRPERGGSIYVDGARTGKGNGNFPSVGERRGVSFVETTLKQGLDFARHKNNDEDLRSSMNRTTRGFLLTQTANGAFATKDPNKAFFVDTDIEGTGINNANARAQGKVLQRVGLATSKPGEFVVILVSQDTRALQEAGI